MQKFTHKIIISIAELSQPNWIIIYKLINRFYDNKIDRTIFDEFQGKVKITIANWALDKDAYSAYGNDLTYENLPPSEETTFSIIYIKQDDKEDFSDLVPFFLLKQKFVDKITLGINVENITIDKNKLGDYIFKCSDFLRFIEDKKPILGQRSIYFINVKIIYKDTGEIKNYSTNNVTSLIGKGKLAGEVISKNKVLSISTLNASRRYLPLLKIDEINFKEFFGHINSTTEETKYIEESVKKISIDLKKKKFPIDEEKYNSIFEEWFIKAYFSSLGIPYNKIGSTRYNGLKKILHSYCNNIYELVQNIIFHGGKKGLIYFVFNKKENISENQKKRIPDFNTYTKSNQRFIEIGIFDYNKRGIIECFIEKYKPKENFELIDFFDPKSIINTGLTHLEMRHTAHLGIKSFVKFVINNKGYFSVESNNKNIKQRVESIYRGKNESCVQNLNDEDFADGTHYQIILPVQFSDNDAILPIQPKTQKRSFIDKLRNRILDNKFSIRHIHLIDILIKLKLDIDIQHSKEEQIQYIEAIGGAILKEINVANEIAIDLSQIGIDIKFIFKLLSYIQLSCQSTYEKIILTGISNDTIEEFCNTIMQFLIDTEIVPIWSKNSALILVNENLHYQIICGETKDDLYYLNNEFKKYYYPQKNYFDNENITPHEVDELNKFLLPYEILIERNKHSYFEQSVLDILMKDIESEEMGYLVKHEYTYIGNKLIIRNFYEADSMFQNSFYAERFAYLIAREIQQSQKLQEIKKNGEKAVIIGYKPYSDFLVKAIKYLVDIPIETVVIANEDKDGDGIIFSFDKSIDTNGDVIEDKIKDNPNNYKFITIVPIGSTLTTTDKIIAFFKLHINRSKASYCDLDFVYNHCSIVVRDEILIKPTYIEQKQKWESFIDEKTIKTNFENASTIHFSVQIAAKDGNSNWMLRLNDRVSFPRDWNKEQYVNLTENSSINSQNLMGYPRVNKSSIDAPIYKHETELDRLYELKENIYSGHIECHRSHYRYYFDTETFIKRKKKPEFDKWIKDIANNKSFKKDIVNVLITPNAKLESDFINIINDKVFDGNALIIYLDINNWRNNITHKLSYLQHLNNKGKQDKDEPTIEFHYADHALLTSQTYIRVKSYMNSIIPDFNDFYFKSIITLINRLSYDRDKEIRRDVDSNLFAFINFFIPPSKDPERDCILCTLFKYYDKLKKNTVLETCNAEISENLSKIKLKYFNKESEKSDEILDKEKDTERPPELINERKFIRMFLTHEILYIISNINSNIAPNEQEERINQYLDSLYNGSNKTKLDQWHETASSFSSIGWDIKHYFDNKFFIDKEISFLKVISSPPLSQYIRIRKYAHKKLLLELANILPQKDAKGDFIFKKQIYKYDDVRKLKAILKSLSFLKSNALVRKDIITGAWAICFQAMNQLSVEIASLNDLKNKIDNDHPGQDKVKDQLLYKVQISKKDIETGKLNFSDDDEKTNIERKIRSIIDEELYTLNKGKIALINNFRSEFQFYIKNAIFEDEAKSMYIGELLRTGNEMTVPIPKDFSISQTTHRNTLFTQFEKESSYKEFLVWLFYDNTTIIRKTLQNFEKELEKDKNLKCYFYNNENLNAFNEIKKKKNDITSVLVNKIKKEYYYSNFNYYLNNGDNIKFIEKLIYALFAQKKIRKLNSDQGKTDIEADFKTLLEIFAAIMDADAAFFSMNRQETFNRMDDIYVYPISHYSKDVKNPLDISKMFNANNFHATRILKQKRTQFKFPIISKYEIKQSSKESYYGEKSKFEAEHLNHFLIYNSTSNETDLVGIITFLYNKGKYSSSEEFQIKSLESGRLLLLLKNELNKYVTNYLINEKVLDLWIAKKENERKFDKIYNFSAHVFNSVGVEMGEFENINKSNDKTYLQRLCRTWFWLTNETISFLYANIERNLPNEVHKTNFLNIDYHIIENMNDTIGDVFNSTFIELLQALLETRWKTNHLGTNHTITINGYSIDDYQVEDYLSNIKLMCDKHLIRTFIVQCLNNSLNNTSGHGHCGCNEIKNAKITITKNYFKIEDLPLNNYYNDEEKQLIVKNFNEKVKHIKAMNCKNYSSTTLTSLQGFVNYMRDNKHPYHCDYRFNKKKNFVVKITFNKLN